MSLPSSLPTVSPPSLLPALALALPSTVPPPSAGPAVLVVAGEAVAVAAGGAAFGDVIVGSLSRN
ncbi:MAG: hypothetical protein U0168_12225 [Nannocystaceae bacterium]